MTPEEKLNACNHLRRQICNELLRLEAFRQEVNRPGFSGGNIIIANTNGQMFVYRIYPTDDMQDVLNFAEMLSSKRITNMQELLKQIQEE
jgi:hypothetical protein